jgi:transmembrane sensor
MHAPGRWSKTAGIQRQAGRGTVNSSGIRTSISLGRMLVGVSAILLVVFGLQRAGLFSDGRIFRTQRGELREIALSDGSSFTLNTESELSVTVDAGLRSARLLRGEAYADIVADDHRPFAIYAGPGRIVASGAARVHLRLWNGEIRVGIAAGEVRLNQWHQASIPLRAEQSVRYDVQGKTSGVRPYVAAAALAWRQHKLVLHDTALPLALQELLRYHGGSAVIDAVDLNRVPVTGELPTDDLPAALRALEQLGPFAIRLDEGRVVHVHRSR